MMVTVVLAHRRLASVSKRVGFETKTGPCKNTRRTLKGSSHRRGHRYSGAPCSLQSVERLFEQRT